MIGMRHRLAVCLMYSYSKRLAGFSRLVASIFLLPVLKCTFLNACIPRLLMQWLIRRFGPYFCLPIFPKSTFFYYICAYKD